MATSFYTSVQIYNGKIMYRGVEAGRKVKRQIDYHPTLYVSSPKPTKFTTIHGEYVDEIKPGTIVDCREYIKKYEGVENFKIFGNRKYEYTFISDDFPDEIDWDVRDINVCNIDIEVGSENGFPNVESASEPITAITFKTHNKFIAFGCGPFTTERNDVQYVRCRDEIDLIKRFIDEWSGNYPDVITGWNVRFFDIPYLVNRITSLLGVEFARRLSPWNRLTERQITIMGKDQITFVPMGISVLDYIELYKKFAPNGMSQSSYKLDEIANVELGEGKLSYEEHENLHTLYRDDHQKFIEYNIKDVELVDRLENKLKLLELAFTLAYDSKCNFDDVFAQTRMWDALIYNQLRKHNVVLPPSMSNKKDEAYIGAYVKDPQIGLHKWVVSFDLTSLYPSLIQQFNISPEMLIEPQDYTPMMLNLKQQSVDVDSLLSQEIDTSRLKSESVTMTPNRQFFRVQKQGFLSELMEKMFNDRVTYKKIAIESKKKLELEFDAEKRVEIERKIARYENLQLAKKVCLNSAYGALGNPYFRLYDVRLATAITTSGQLAIRWIEHRLNVYLNKLLKTDKDYVIASDTDSVYLSLDEIVHQAFDSKNLETKRVIEFLDQVCEKKLQPYIDKSYQALAAYLNSFKQKMTMKREVLTDRAIWTAKKRYILNVHNSEGVAYAQPKIKIMGLEVKKSSTPLLFRDKMQKCIDIILNGDQEQLIDYIASVRKEMNTARIEDISFPRGVNGLGKYKGENSGDFKSGCPIHVRGSILHNHLLDRMKLTKKYPKINEGEKIKFVYLKEPNVLRSNIISYPTSPPGEFGIESMIDYEVMFQKGFVEPIKSITDAINWKTEHVSTLEAFFPGWTG
jgi:DNA polymerase elongation subunit (family B)